MATESSDALHFLFQYISLDEVVHEIELQGSNVQDEYALEAKLVWRGLSRKLDGEPTADKDTAKSYEFPTKRVLSLVELLRALALLSSKLRKREK